MSYNGIGLQTPRGSGTNGHISKNLSSVRRREPYSASIVQSIPQLESKRHADLGILQHEAKRQIQNRVLIYRTELEDASPAMAEAEIEEKVSRYREQVEAEAMKDPKQLAGRERFKAYQSHDIAISKTKEMDVLRSALGVSDKYQEGTAMKRTRDIPSEAKESTPYDPNQESRVNPLDRRRGRRRSDAYERRDDRGRRYNSPQRRRDRDDDLDRYRPRPRRSSPDRWKHERQDFRADPRRPEDRAKIEAKRDREQASTRRERSRTRSYSRSSSRGRSRSPSRVRHRPSNRNRSTSRSRSRRRSRSTSGPRSVSYTRRRRSRPRRRNRSRSLSSRSMSRSRSRSRSASPRRDRRSRRSRSRTRSSSRSRSRSRPRSGARVSRDEVKVRSGDRTRSASRSHDSGSSRTGAKPVLEQAKAATDTRAQPSARFSPPPPVFDRRKALGID